MAARVRSVRRRAAAAALVAFAGCAGFAACSWGSSWTYLHLRSSGAVIVQENGGPAQVAWYRDGELVGAAAALDPGFPMRDALDLSRAVDHPELPAWRERLVRLRTLAATPGTRAADLAREADDFPFERAVEECADVWIAGAPERAAELLDVAAELEVGDAFAAQTVRLATTDGDAEAVADARVAAWVRALARQDHDEALAELVRHPRTGRAASLGALASLGELPSHERLDLFATAARWLAADAAAAPAIVEAAEELPSHEEAAGLAPLLRGHASAELARLVLRRLDDRPAHERAGLFALAVARAGADEAAHDAIAAALADVPAHERASAARTAVAAGGTSPDLLRALVARVDRIPGYERADVLLTVLDAPAGADAAVRTACAEAARRHVPRMDRERVLQRAR